jgi:hypothetical protein
MKASILFYIISLVILATAIFMAVQYPSNQVQSMAGGLTLIGFSLNVAGYLLKNRKSVVYKPSVSTKKNISKPVTR